MSQTNCPSTVPSVSVPVKGIRIKLAESAFEGLIPDPPQTVIDYSAEEQFTGAHWVDGKKIYRKTVYCGTLEQSQGTTSTGIEGLDRVISFKATSRGFYEPASSVEHLPIPCVGTHPDYNISVWLQNNSIIYDTNQASRAGYDLYVTLEYTRTDR